MLDYRINTFLTVCKHMNYTMAAEELHITQPAVSLHIRFLEEHYHTKLFSIEGKRIHLTNEGVLLKRAMTTMKHDQLVLQEKIEDQEDKFLNFGATRTIGDYVMPKKIIEYKSKYPMTKLQMLVDNTEALLQKLDSGDIDFAIIEGYFPKNDYEHLEYRKARFIAVAETNYADALQNSTLEDLLKESVILREHGSGTREILERHLRQHNFSIQDFSKVMEIGSISAIKSLVSSGLGITFLYEDAVSAELEAGLLKEILISDFSLYNSFTMIWRKNSLYFAQYQELFCDFFIALSPE